MRKTNLLGATFLALATASLPCAGFAQSPSTTPTAPAAAPMAAPAPAPADVTPAAPAPDASAPATTTTTTKPAKTMHHHKAMTKSHKGGKLVATRAGDRAVEDLNDESLNSAKTGKPFAPSATPAAAKEEAHAPMHHKSMHHMAKKKAADASAPADAAAAPADTTTTTTTPSADAPK